MGTLKVLGSKQYNTVKQSTLFFPLKWVLTKTNNASKKQPAGRNTAQLVENHVAYAV